MDLEKQFWIWKICFGFEETVTPRSTKKEGRILREKEILRGKRILREKFSEKHGDRDFQIAEFASLLLRRDVRIVNKVHNQDSIAARTYR